MKQFGFSKEERIKKKKDFEYLYSAGKRIYSSRRLLKAVFVLKKSDEIGIKVALAVHRKSGNAVWRNRMKRLLREAYRLNKKELVNLVKEKEQLLLIAFSPNFLNKKTHPKIKLDDILEDFLSLMAKIKKALDA